MTIISSQGYLNFEIVDHKVEELEESGAEYVVIPCWAVGEIDGEEYAVQYDGHHTLEAARELGLEVKFEIEEPEDSLTGEDLLAQHYIDRDWYDVEKSDPAQDRYYNIW